MILKRAGISPIIVLGASFGAWILMMFVVVLIGDLSGHGVTMAILGGGAANIGGTMGVMWHNWTSRHTHVHLEKSAHDARHDALTGLVNRNAFFEELQQTLEASLESGTVFGVIFMDLDRFKAINDSMGHEAGDELLRVVAKRLKNTVRGSDVVARFGGDEFLLICRDLITEKSVLAVAEQLQAAFDKSVSLNGGALSVSCSIGVAVARSGDPRTPEELVRDADAAMYKAKRTRSGLAVFDDAQRLEITDRMETERDLAVALQENQLVVFYQPLVSVAKRRLYGFEALVRWNHPTRGLLGPGDFLDVAEEAGMMARIGEMVLREACAQAAVWNHLNPEARDIVMSVNISEQQILDEGFHDRIVDVLNWSSLSPAQLQLEITEDVVIDHLGGLSALREIASMGVSLAIDDFGTGQSSLSYVKQFDMVSVIKIDRTFVADPSSANRAIIEAVTTMARAMDLTVVAEGVETEEQLRYLIGCGVDIMQGYLFNVPIAAEKVDPNRWFAARPAGRKPGLRPNEVSRALSGFPPDEAIVDAGEVEGYLNRPERRA